MCEEDRTHRLSRRWASFNINSINRRLRNLRERLGHITKMDQMSVRNLRPPTHFFHRPASHRQVTGKSPASDRQRMLESQPRQEISCAEEMQKAVEEASTAGKSPCLEEVLACL
jgi:hypothetical protein